MRTLLSTMILLGIEEFQSPHVKAGKNTTLLVRPILVLEREQNLARSTKYQELPYSLLSLVPWLSLVVLGIGSGAIGPVSLARSGWENNVSFMLSLFDNGFDTDVSTASFDNEAPYIKYPVLVIAALVAAVQAIPLLLSSLWHSASTALGRGRTARFTTRDSFARGRGDYAVVDEDEGELLGDESDEEV